MLIFLTGSLKDEGLSEVAAQLRAAGYDVFDDWRAAGREADRCWRDYELDVERGYSKAVHCAFAVHIREFDRRHLAASKAVVGVCKPHALPGRSSLVELAYASMVERLPTFVLLRGEPDEWDVMLPLAVDKFCSSIEELLEELEELKV